jgi:hypothetical protein
MSQTNTPTVAKVEKPFPTPSVVVVFFGDIGITQR